MRNRKMIVLAIVFWHIFMANGASAAVALAYFCLLLRVECSLRVEPDDQVLGDLGSPPSVICLQSSAGSALAGGLLFTVLNLADIFCHLFDRILVDLYPLALRHILDVHHRDSYI